MRKKKYRSPLEKRLHTGPLKQWKYEPARYGYTIERDYTPDFEFGNIWIEAKGFFRVGDTAKYKAIREAYPDKTLIFVFTNPNKLVRKSTKITMGEWAKKNGWLYTTEDKVKILLITLAVESVR